MAYYFRKYNSHTRKETNVANNTKKPTASSSTKKPASTAKKNTSKKAPERDEYAYYDDLYEKKPRKKRPRGVLGGNSGYPRGKAKKHGIR